MKQTIAVLGGGMSSLVTVFELTSLPGWKDRYDITVYQEGWRLGGKGASGRNAAMNQRIEEHGLHILFGFYDNAFRIMRACYRELGRHPDAPLATVEKAFEPADLIVMMEKHEGRSAKRDSGDGWEPWPLMAPRNHDVPGVGPSRFDPLRLLEEVLGWTAQQIETFIGLQEESPIAVARLSIRARLPHDIRDDVRRLVFGGATRTSLLDFFFEAVGTVRGGLEQFGEAIFVELAHKIAQTRDHVDHELIVKLVDRFDEFLWARPIHDKELRRLRMMIDFSLAVARGLVADGLIGPDADWFSIDDLDLRQWLKKHGAHEETVNSPMVTGLYDAAFSTYEPSAAGTSLHGFLRMALTYKGAVMYKMQAGMGDTIFAPLYEVLRRRGVKFEFFEQVQSIELTDDEKQVARIRMRRQAKVRDGEYRPLVDVKGLPCWPSAPLFEQLVDGEALAASDHDLEDWWASTEGEAHDLVLDRDFHLVVLGISIGAFPYIAKDLIAANTRFADMVKHVKTTQTQCFQSWLRPGLGTMGWATDEAPVTIPYGEPFDTWADMTHLVSVEDWPPATVGHLAYLCSAMEDDGPLPPRDVRDYAKKQNERCKKNAIEWMKTQAGALWPGLATTDDPNAIELGHLVDPQNRLGEARFDAQYWRAPYSPSERYVLAVPGSNRHRLRADESGFSNLFLCGDWTKTAMSVGCLEGATMGGVQAARAIDPRVKKATGDWLPDISRAAPPPRESEPVVIAPIATRRAVRELPRYIETDGNQIASPPIEIGVRVSMFLLEANLDSLRAICDQQLNLPGSPVRYEPLGPFCVLYCSHVDNYPQVNPIGWVPEKDFGIWMPVVAGRGRGSLFVPERVVTYTPYIWVDNGVALVGGRTVFGFAKQLGDMRLPNEPGENAEYTLDTLVVPRYAPTARAEQRRVLTVRRRDRGVLGELRDAWHTGENLVDTFGRQLEHALRGEARLPVPSWSFVRRMITDASHGMRMVFLKQFPDATFGSRACYQAIVEADLPIVSTVKGGLLEGDWEAEIRRYDSHRIVEKLGLATRSDDGAIAVVPSIAHGWAKFEAMVKPGVIVHQTT